MGWSKDTKEDIRHSQNLMDIRLNATQQSNLIKQNAHRKSHSNEIKPPAGNPARMKPLEAEIYYRELEEYYNRLWAEENKS